MDKDFQFLFSNSLSNIKVTNCFNHEPRFNNVFSQINLLIIKYGAYVTNLDDRNSKGTYWVLLFIARKTTLYFDSFGIEYIPQEVLNEIKNKSITRNIFRKQDNIFIICKFYCMVFIEYMLAGKTR